MGAFLARGWSARASLLRASPVSSAGSRPCRRVPQLWRQRGRVAYRYLSRTFHRACRRGQPLAFGSLEASASPKAQPQLVFLTGLRTRGVAGLELQTSRMFQSARRDQRIYVLRRAVGHAARTLDLPHLVPRAHRQKVLAGIDDPIVLGAVLLFVQLTVASSEGDELAMRAPLHD